MIDKINPHYSFENPASVYDEEALTALELAGRTASKTNEVVEDQNNLRKETAEHLTAQDKEIAENIERQDKYIQDNITRQDATIKQKLDVTMPSLVVNEVNSHIRNGDFDNAIDEYAGELTDRLDNLLNSTPEGSTTMDAEIIDGRLGSDGVDYDNIGNAIRNNDRRLLNYIKTIRDFILSFNTDDFEKITATFEPGWYNHNTQQIQDATLPNKHTNYIPVLPGELFVITTEAGYQANGVIFFNHHYNVVGTAIIPNSSGTQVFENVVVTVPSNAEYMVVNSLFREPDPTILRSPSILNLCEKNTELFSLLSSFVLNYSEGLPFKFVDVSGDYPTTNIYVDKSTGNEVSSNDARTTDYINIWEHPEFYVTARAQYYTCVISVYDENKTFIGSIHKSPAESSGTNVVVEGELVHLLNITTEFPAAYYIRFTSIYNTLIIKTREFTPINAEAHGNVLKGKKWVACGDSYTEGDFTGYTDENGNTLKNSDAYDSEMGVYKTYPWWIAKRNDMTLINEAKCGTTMHSNNNNAFSETRYIRVVGANADYVTLCFGLNESDYSNIGTPTDTDITTLWGAYNTVIKQIISGNPFVKIGIIIPNSWLSETHRNTLIEIAKYWGVPYLDLKGDTSVPITMGGRYESVGGVCDDANYIRTNAMKVSDDNNHPNVKAHEYLSTIVENFLRSL